MTGSTCCVSVDAPMTLVSTNIVSRTRVRSYHGLQMKTIRDLRDAQVMNCRPDCFQFPWHNPYTIAFPLGARNRMRQQVLIFAALLYIDQGNANLKGKKNKKSRIA